MIRQATLKDLPAISHIHCLCFTDSFITQLSKYKWLAGDLLSDFYKDFMLDHPELFVIAENEHNEIVGFCMGYYMNGNTNIDSFLKRHFYRVSIKSLFLLLTGSKYAWLKILSYFKHKPSVDDWTVVNDKYEFIKEEDRGDLLSICVLAEYRGREYAHDLINFYLSNMKSSGRKLCLLSVKQDNHRAISFYKRNGFELYRTRGSKGFTFMKLL